MKKYLFFIIALFALTSCDYFPTITRIITNKDSLYNECKDLKGLYDLHIDKTTLTEIKKYTLKKSSIPNSFFALSKDITFMDYSYRKYLIKYLETHRLFFNDYYLLKANEGTAFYNDDENKCELNNYFDTNVNEIQQYYINDYKIGSLKVNVNCAFYNDTLVAISFKGDEDIKKGYIEKYGVGNGYKKHRFYHPIFDENVEYIFESDEIRRWENDILTMVYVAVYKSFSYKKNAEKYESDVSEEFYLITSNKNYNKFINLAQKYIKMFKDEKDNEKNDKIKQLLDFI